MALLNKLFSTKKKTNNNKHVVGNVSRKPFPFSKDQVRVLLYRECDWRGRRLLFDSNAAQRVRISDLNARDRVGFVETCDGFGYRYLPPNADAGSIGEMIFGAVAMSFRGTSLKVHWMSTPARILCAQVFMSPLSTTFLHSSQGSAESCYSSWASSLNSICDPMELRYPPGHKTNPLDVPYGSLPGSRSSAYSAGDSGYYGNTSTQSSANNVSNQSSSARSSFNSTDSDKDIQSRKFSDVTGYCGSSSTRSDSSTSSQTSIQRRFLRNLSTSFEHDFVENGSNGNTETLTNRNSEDNGRRARLGLAVCVTLSENTENEMECYYLEHIPLIESMLNRLRLFVEQAYITKASFLSLMWDGYEKTAEWLIDLFSGPRIAHPIWLGLVGSSLDEDDTSGLNGSGTVGLDRHGLANGFMDTLYKLLCVFDTKGTNFFISTLITAVLTHHLGWVATVSTPQKISNNSGETSESHDKSVITNNILDVESRNTNLNELSKIYPYNPLWAQLTDLYGANGHPTKLSKTIVNGVDIKVVNHILNMLTYFIRCGEVKRVFNEKIQETESINSLMNRISDDNSLSNSDLKQDLINIQNDCDKNCIEMSTFRENFVKNNSSNKLSVSNFNYKTRVISSETLKSDKLSSGTLVLNENLHQNESKLGLHKAATCASKLNLFSDTGSRSDLTQISNSDDLDKLYPKFDEVDAKELLYLSDSDSNCPKEEFRFCPTEINQKVNKLLRVPKSAVAYHLQREDKSNTSGEHLKENVVGQSLTDLLQAHESKTEVLKVKCESQQTALNESVDSVRKKSNVSYPNLSALITANSIGTGDSKFGWGETNSDNVENIAERKRDKNGVVFVLGENDELIGLKEKQSVSDSSKARDPKFMKTEANNLLNDIDDKKSESNSGAITKTKPPVCRQTSQCKHKHKKHSGVKFNFEKYPQIATNYMRSKNLDISNRQFLEKGIKMDREQAVRDFEASTSFVGEETQECDCCKNLNYQLQTPCNASELEFTSDIATNTVSEVEQYAVEKLVRDEKPTITFVREKLDKTIIQENKDGSVDNIKHSLNQIKNGNLLTNPNNTLRERRISKSYVRKSVESSTTSSTEMKVIHIPMPKSQPKLTNKPKLPEPGFSPSLFSAIADHYIPDMALQGTILGPEKWESTLRRDLVLSTHNRALLDANISESVCIVANVDKMEVRVISSQTHVLPNNTAAGMVGMSQLVSNMLESVLHMWKMRIPAEHCLLYIESKLQELYLRSESLADLLLNTDFCELEHVISTLGVEVTDVPLLLSIASTHSPQVTKKYGLCFK